MTAGTIYMSLMGPQGIRETALDCHRKTNALRQRLLQVEGVSDFFSGPTFHEFALKLPVPAERVVEQMMKQDFGGTKSCRLLQKPLRPQSTAC